VCRYLGAVALTHQTGGRNGHLAIAEFVRTRREMIVNGAIVIGQLVEQLCGLAKVLGNLGLIIGAAL